jgi:predicted RecA/RadA family phage recombinase
MPDFSNYTGVVSVTLTSAVTVGTVYAVGDGYGVAQEDNAASVPTSFLIDSVAAGQYLRGAPKVTGTAFLVGEVLYYNGSAFAVSTATTGADAFAVAGATAGATTCDVAIHPRYSLAVS